MKTIYQQAKSELRQFAKEVKKQYPTDKPAVRQAVNDYADSLCKSLKLSEYQRNLLSDFACELHPKK